MDVFPKDQAISRQLIDSTRPLQLRVELQHVYFLLILVYPLLVKFLRHDRLQSTRKTFGYTTRRSLAQMTDEDAFEIQVTIAQLEFPFTFQKALQFALFRTYGIPSVSKLLVATSQFSDVSTASKRYADTSLLVREFMSHKPSDLRAHEAIARMNYIHSMYQKNGSILDDDMLYTLSLFALEPMRWIERYEWRKLEAFEQCALGTFWKSIGDAMGISYENLKSVEEGWEDGLHWLHDLTEWSHQYEKENMVPHGCNKKTANQTVAILLWGLPRALKPFGERVVSVLMDDRLRTAMMYAFPDSCIEPNPLVSDSVPRYEKPSKFYFSFVSSIFILRKYLLKYFCLPRPIFLRVNALQKPGPDGRCSVSFWEGAPYYAKPTFWRRWGPAALASRLLGLPVPGDEGDKYHPQGYKIPEVGPDKFLGKGAESAKETVHGLAKTRTGGCPFVRVKAR
ncbi:MAG: hypothetical protein Q9166_000396 [cf. Caloplaca sp. 2 TL-2023]